MTDELLIDSSLPTSHSHHSATSNHADIIKVIGVGGGGGNAVSNMYRENIEGVRFLVCNTDSKALEDSPVPDRLQLGPGLGAGGDPSKGCQLAEENIEEIRAALDDRTKMVFITAGMGGGTGTGAGPIVAREAMRKGILTIGIVTIPFLHEMRRNIDKALDGVERMAEAVDALLVVNNERLKQVYSDLSVANAFKKADDTLTKAVSSIVEIITMRGTQNLDFCDVETCLRGGGVAIMSSGFGRGEKRTTKAIQEALNSPLLNDKEVEKSKSLRMAIFFPPDETGNGMMMEELGEVSAFMEKFNEDVDTKWGYAEDPSLTDEIKITILASGFRLSDSEKESTTVKRPLTPEEIERERERSKRRDDAYGDTKQRVRYHRVHLFSPEDLENEELVASLDARPVSKRTDSDTRNFRSLSNKSTPMELLGI